MVRMDNQMRRVNHKSVQGTQIEIVHSQIKLLVQYFLLSFSGSPSALTVAGVPGTSWTDTAWLCSSPAESSPARWSLQNPTNSNVEKNQFL